MRFLAHYLPQFHPIPENDQFWGEGFTEWTNVTKARKYFSGHYQPRVPADLGYYDLRDEAVRRNQAELARSYGIEGFIYYHYWFGNGKQVLQHPLEEVLRLKEPNFPFCICWANESWRGVWFGARNKTTLIEQTYPGVDDYRAHFKYLLPFFRDPRYIRVDGKCLFFLYIPADIPDLKQFCSLFRSWALEAGIGDLYILGGRCPEGFNPLEHGLDGLVGAEFVTLRYMTAPNHESVPVFRKLIRKIQNRLQGNGKLDFETRKKPLIISYKKAIRYLLPEKNYPFDYYPCVINDWDNTARAGTGGIVFHQSTPRLWRQHLEEACTYVKKFPEQKQLVFIKSWNEWAEGNYLEPDAKWGHAYLEQVAEVKQQFENRL